MALVILAAGSSSRLGQPKQLVKHEGTTLLNRTIDIALSSQIGNVYVVLGYKMKIIKDSIQNPRIKIIENNCWHLGIGQSISCATTFIKPKKYNAIMFLLSDTLFLNQKILKQLQEAFETNKNKIVFSRYTIGQGPPIIFDRSLYEELEILSGHDGAKSIIKNNLLNAEGIDFPKGHIDIDTPDDLNLLR